MRHCLERALLCALLPLAACSSDAAASFHSDKSLIVIGIDGMDPNLARRFMADGQMPNLSKLIEMGDGLHELQTTFPPQSPVAWSTFITGQTSEVHGIFDFVHRNPKTLEPYLSTSRIEEPDHVLSIGSLRLPLSSGGVVLLRKGRAFWLDLEDAQIPATLVKIPSNFPPTKSHHAESLSGMGTPDILGTYGTFHLFTNDPEFRDRSISGGIVEPLDFDGQKASGYLHGPHNPLSTTPEEMTLRVQVIVDRRRPVALIRVGDQELILQPGEWSPWLEVAFDPGILAGETRGIVRFYLESLRPSFNLYASPINLDPRDPAMPISSPPQYAKGLAHDIGRFYTQGMPTDTKALIGGVLSDAEFLSQVDLVVEERMAMYERELARFKGGLLFFYFGFVDQLSHVYWREMESEGTPNESPYAHVIRNAYHRADEALGKVVELAERGIPVVVISDHGFAPFHKKVQLNTWLARHGYLSLHTPEDVQPGPLGHIDWANTQAYALGLNELFLNLRGREAHGVVAPKRRKVLIDRLTRELESWRDPETGDFVITGVLAPDPSRFPDRTPDLIIGYHRGYRSSDESGLGRVADREIEPNTGKWSGDHCMNPAHVPGSLVSTLPVRSGTTSLGDLAPTILSYFGLTEAAEALPGKSIFAK